MTNTGGVITLKEELVNKENQLWIRKVQDEVDQWFTLNIPEKNDYLTAEDSDAIKTTSKNNQKFHKRFILFEYVGL